MVARMQLVGSFIRDGLILLAAASACAAALHNVLNYREIFQQSEKEAATDAEWLNGATKDTGPMAALSVRVNLYRLLEALGKDESLQHGDTAVFVSDAEFFDGAYIDKPIDTILERCAIQPFSVPALTGMPLISALRARRNGCKYDSYGYQYLPMDTSTRVSELSQPCALAQLRGIKNVVVIKRKDQDFSAMKVVCGNH
jgi:hypothetical protein